MRAIQPKQTLVDKSPSSVNNEALGSAAHPQKKTKPSAKKPKAPEEQAMDEQSAEALAAEALAEEWPAPDTEATLQGQHAGGEDLLLAQADTAVVSDAGGGAASASSSSATTSAVTTTTWGAGLPNTAWLLGGLGLVGVAAAAGGSGSRAASTSTSDTTAPTFTEGATVGVDFSENGTGTVHTAAATDNVGVNAYAFADGGADNDKFDLDTTTGELTFKEAPDFETPGSADGSNAYTVKVKAVDAEGNEAVQTVTVTVTNVDEVPPVTLIVDTRLQSNTPNSFPQVTSLADGGYVVAYTAAPTAGMIEAREIVVQRYDASNRAVGGGHHLQGTSGWAQAHPEIAALDDGGYVVVWTNHPVQSYTSNDICIQRFNASNVAVGNTVHLQGASTGYNGGTEITSLNDGGYLVTWRHTPTGSQDTLISQRFDVHNNPVGPIQSVHIADANLDVWHSHTVALSDGGYVIAWQVGTSGGNDHSVFLQRFDANSNQVGSMQRLQGVLGDLNSYTPRLMAMNDGAYAVAWASVVGAGKGADIFVQRFDASNHAVGVMLQLDAVANEFSESSPEMTFLPDGGFVVAWTVHFTDFHEVSNAYLQRFDANGAALSSPYRLHGGSLYDSTPKVVTLTDGGYVVTWTGGSRDGQPSGPVEGDLDIYLQRFDAANHALGEVQRFQGTAGEMGEDGPHIAALTDGGFVLSWMERDGLGRVLVQRFDAEGQPVDEPALTTAQTFTLWQEAADAHGGDTSKDINALNARSADIVAQRDTTSRDGSANQADPAKRLTEYVDQVTGTDIVSAAEFNAGFAITGKAAAGASGTIKFYLDNDRTNGTNEMGVQLQDGQDGVSIAYDNATGDYTISFAASSTALLQATHNTYGSGVHQLTVDTDGSGTKDGSGATLEASRLFLVASGTAQTTDTGTVAQNYSVQDTVTKDVFVYYHGDPDGDGIGLWTALDNGDSASDQGTVDTDQDGNSVYSSDWDYYNNPTANTNAATTPATASNTALHFVTDIAAQTWEFHMATHTNWAPWDAANTQATDHTGFGSNTSRQASLAEAIALYAANFGGDSAGGGAAGNTVGAVQPMSNVGSTNAYTSTEDNRPGGWDIGMWTAAPTPSGHAQLSLSDGDVVDAPDADGYHDIDFYVPAVL